MDITNLINRYNIYIYERFNALLTSGKKDFTNNDLCKIFEYYSAIKLSQEYNQTFYEYSDIDPCFKEDNKMSRNDTGIDLCNLEDTIVQCKLRDKSLSWGECGTFFGSQNMFYSEHNRIDVRWEYLVITRNESCKLTKNLEDKSDLFIDKVYNKNELLDYCRSLKKFDRTKIR